MSFPPSSGWIERLMQWVTFRGGEKFKWIIYLYAYGTSQNEQSMTPRRHRQRGQSGRIRHLSWHFSSPKKKNKKKGLINFGRKWMRSWLPDKKAIEERLSWRVGVSSVRLGEIMRGCSAVFLRIVIIHKRNWEKMNTFFLATPWATRLTWGANKARGRRRGRRGKDWTSLEDGGTIPVAM